MSRRFSSQPGGMAFSSRDTLQRESLHCSGSLSIYSGEKLHSAEWSRDFRNSHLHKAPPFSLPGGYVMICTKQLSRLSCGMREPVISGTVLGPHPQGSRERWAMSPGATSQSISRREGEFGSQGGYSVYLIRRYPPCFLFDKSAVLG